MNRSNSPTVPLKSIKLLFRQCPFHGSINLLWILALMTNAENLIVSTISIELSLVFMCCGSMDNVEIRKQPLTRKLIKTSIILLRDEITEWSAVRWWLIQKLLLSNACKTSYKFSYTKKIINHLRQPSARTWWMSHNEQIVHVTRCELDVTYQRGITVEGAI